MTWQLSAYGLLALVLVGGLGWYERSRPPARIVALVAALAALAVAGRLALTPIPNVVATTDVVLITGYAVGAAPGFAVGALAAAVSNLWLGQGPWTPWQMAGWGLVGLAGAALAAATGRRVGRGGLAAACGLAGLAYGALLDLSVMVTYGGEQSLDRYLAISARGVPFNVAHAAGNVVLALCAGPALVRIISRYRSRFEFTWPKRAPATTRTWPGGASASLLAVLALALWAPAVLASGSGSARGWLERAQHRDGGYGAEPGGPSGATMTGWAALGLEAAGRNPLDLGGGPSPIDYLRARASSLRSTGDLERTILVLRGAGVSPRRFGGRDLVAELRRRRSRSGSFEGQVNLTAFGILALRGAGTPTSALARSAAWLRRAGNRDGGWGFQPQAGSDSDSTGAALQGLAAAGNRGRRAARGAAYLRRAQQRDGGFALAGGGDSNAQSTAWAVQGLVAASVDPARLRKRGRSPLDYLARRQVGDGHYRYSSSSDQTPVWVTGQALIAVNRRAFPLPPVPRAARSAPSPPGQESGAAAPLPAGAGASSATGRVARASRREPALAGPGPGRPARRDTSPSARRSGPRVAATPVDARAASAEAPQGHGGGPGPTAYVGGGFAALATVLAAGFLWYRRRLP